MKKKSLEVALGCSDAVVEMAVQLELVEELEVKQGVQGEVATSAKDVTEEASSWGRTRTGVTEL